MKDCLGNELNIGDLVIYAEQLYGSKYELKKYIVFKINPKSISIKKDLNCDYYQTVKEPKRIYNITADKDKEIK